MAREAIRLVLLAALLVATRTTYGQGQPILQAAEVARIDFAQHLSQRHDGDSDFTRFVADIANYNIGISESRDFYVVVFLPNDPKHLSDGGGAEYRVDKKTLKILHVKGYK